MAGHKLTPADAAIGGIVTSYIPGRMAEIGRCGGLALTPEQHAEHGAKGGAALVARRGREYMAEIGRRGREARKAKKESGR